MTLDDLYLSTKHLLTHEGNEAMEALINASDYTYMKENVDGTKTFVGRTHKGDGSDHCWTIHTDHQKKIISRQMDVVSLTSDHPTDEQLQAEGWYSVVKTEG